MAEAKQRIDPEYVEQVDGSSTLEALTRGEIDTQIRTAKAYPRSIKRFLNEATDMACLNEQIAESCIYALPRAGKTIEGPSARLAEIVASAWGNCRAGARIVSEENNFIVAQGVFLDLERNVAITFESKRRITDRNGRRYSDDMIVVTSNAACSIALRNAVFKGVPKAFWGSIYEAAKKTAIGDAKSLASKRDEMVLYFGKMGVGLDRILAAVNCPSLEDIGADELAILKGTANTIKDGEITLEDAFPVERQSKPKEETREPQNGERANGEQARDLASQLRSQRAGNGESKPVVTEEQNLREPGDESEQEEDEGQQPEEISRPSNENSTDEKRATLAALFAEVVKIHGSQVAGDRLEVATGRKKVESVKAEKLGAGIDTMLQMKELKPAK